jgi:hypothetical protein
MSRAEARIFPNHFSEILSRMVAMIPGQYNTQYGIDVLASMEIDRAGASGLSEFERSTGYVHRHSAPSESLFHRTRMFGRSSPGIIQHFSQDWDAVVPASEEKSLKQPPVSLSTDGNHVALFMLNSPSC